MRQNPHYRHTHISSWNKIHSSSRYRNSAHYSDDDYEIEKSKINERAKRQIIRKATEFLKENGISVDHVLMLEGTTDETISIAKKKL